MNARKFFDSTPVHDSDGLVLAANNLSLASVAVILDAQGLYLEGVAHYEMRLPSRTHFLSLNGRDYRFGYDEFPEYTDMMHLRNARNALDGAPHPSESMGASQQLSDELLQRILARYEEALMWAPTVID